MTTGLAAAAAAVAGPLGGEADSVIVAATVAATVAAGICSAASRAVGSEVTAGGHRIRVPAVVSVADGPIVTGARGLGISCKECFLGDFV